MNVWQWRNLVLSGVLFITVLEALMGFYTPTLDTLSTGLPFSADTNTNPSQKARGRVSNETPR